MTSVGSRPMATPDLAGLLSKRRPQPTKNTDDSRPLVTPSKDSPPGPEVVTAPKNPDGLRAEQTRQLPSELPGGSRPDIDTGTGTATSDIPKRPRRKARSEKEREDQPRPSTVPREYLQIKAVNLPRSLHRELGRQSAARGTTQTALILTAINETHARLAVVLAAEGTRAEGESGELFDIPQVRAGGKEPYVQTTIRITDRQFDVIDRLVAELGTNRSRLVTEALTMYFAA